MNRFPTLPWRLAASGPFLLLAACGGNGSDTATGAGFLTLGVTDAPVDSAETVVVQFDGVEIQPAAGEPITVGYDAPRQIDLLDQQGGQRELLLDDYALAPGDYGWMRLMVSAGADGVLDSWIGIDGAQYELEIPGGDQNGLKLNTPFTVPDGGHVDFTVDFDLRKSVHEPRGHTGPSGDPVYMLRPSLRLVATDQVGAISGFIDPAVFAGQTCSLPRDGYAVYAFDGPAVTPDDIDGIDPDPVSSTGVELDANGQWSWRIAYLPRADYTIAATCQADLDDPETDDSGTVQFTGEASVSVTAGADTVHNFVPMP